MSFLGIKNSELSGKKDRSIDEFGSNSVKIKKSVTDCEELDIFNDAVDEIVTFFTDEVVEVHNTLLKVIARKQVVPQMVEMSPEVILTVMLA